MVDKFFVNPSSSRKRTVRQSGEEGIGSAAKRSTPRISQEDEDITSESEAEVDISEAESESDHENETDKRRRLAKEYLATLETDLVEGFDAKDLDDDIIARRLRHDAAEQQGHIFRDLRAARVSEIRKTRTPQCRNLTTVAAAGKYVYVGAKDGSLSKWQLRDSKEAAGAGAGAGVDAVPIKAQPVARVVCSTPQLDRKAGAPVLSVAVNTANKLVVTGFNGGFAVWSAESLELLREFRVHGSVLSLAFRRNTSELYVGGSDLRLRTYDLSQWAFVETLHGHQDEIIALSALSQERCVSVGARDRTVIFWKIPEESRLTFRGGDTKMAAKLQQSNPTDENGEIIDPVKVTLEGSIDCCAMLDHQMFVTGSDNGNVALWSTNRKKPQFVEAKAHGMNPALLPVQASGETDPARAEIPPALPRSITSIAAVPFSNTFFTGSTSGTVCIWSLDEEKKKIQKIREINVGDGVVTALCVSELNAEFAVVATLSREPRLGRWLVCGGRDQIISFRLVE